MRVTEGQQRPGAMVGGEGKMREGSDVVAVPRRCRVASPEGLLSRAVDWLEGLPEGLERQGQILCASPLWRHRLRVRVAVEQARPELLWGVGLISPARSARQVLASHGEPATLGAEAVRRLRLREIFRQPHVLGLSYFDPGQVEREPGYVEAFARTLGALEQAGMAPEALRRAAARLDDEKDARRALDVARVWEAVVGQQGHTDASAWRRAAALVSSLERSSPTLVILTEAPDPSLVAYLQALDPGHLFYLDARPDSVTVDRRLRVLGLPARAHESSSAETSELSRLKARLFESGGGVGPGYDGTVELEAYASVEEELEAAVGWVMEQVEAGVGLSRIALVLPRVELLAGVLLDRLSRAEPPIPAYLAGGLPRGETPGGMRILALLDALGSGLEAEATLRILPWLVTEGERGGQLLPPEERAALSVEVPEGLSPSRAAELVYGAGILGGTHQEPGGGLEWVDRLEAKLGEVRARLLEGALPPVGSARSRAEALLADLSPRMPAIAAMEGLLRRVVEDEAPLSQLAPALMAFLSQWMVLPSQPVELLEHVSESLTRLAQDPAASRLRGHAALEVMRNAVARGRAPIGRLDEGIFVGSPRRCSGVSFDAVRLMGLAEGVYPRVPHDDPVLPSDLRARLEVAARVGERAPVIRRMEDALDDDLHTFYRVIQAATQRLSLSIPRQWLDRSERAMSGLVLEVLNALGASVEGASQESDLSSLGHLHTERLRPGVARLREVTLAQGATPRAGFGARRRRYERDGHLPPRWMPEYELSLFAMVDEGGDQLAMPGLRADAPLSAGWLRMLLTCPFRFLQERVLGRHPTESRPPTDRLEPRAFGSLVHDAVEVLFEARGSAICAHEGSLEAHLEAGKEALRETLAALRATYPLRGGETVARELSRAWRVMAEVVRREWAMPARRFEAVELSFGFEAPVALSAGEQRLLYLRGRIDRLDALEGGHSVRDLKTGRGRAVREERLNVGRDVQLGLYARVVAEVLRPGVPVVEAVYEHPSGGGAPERAFRGEALAELESRTQGWLTTAADLLEARVFPRTTSAFECRYCPFRPMCGDGAAARSAAALSEAEAPALVAFRTLREVEDV